MTTPDRGTEGQVLPGLVLAQELPWPSTLPPALSPPSQGRDEAPFEFASRRPLAPRARGSSGPVAEVARILLVALVYYVAARVSLRLSLVGRQVTPIWPPTGIAVVGLLVLGRRTWPGIALGALLVNAPISHSLLAGAGIAVGNTLAPLLAVSLLEKVGFRTDRDRSEGQLQQFVLHYLAMHIVLSRQPGVARMLEALHFPIGSGQLPGFGALPITHIASAITTRLPPDQLVIESAELSGKDLFEELINTSDIEQLRDPLQERLRDIMSAKSPVS